MKRGIIWWRVLLAPFVLLGLGLGLVFAAVIKGIEWAFDAVE